MELLLAQRLDDSVTVTSAGTNGMPTWPISEPMAALLPAAGIAPADIAEFRSRRLTEQIVGDANLILTATAEHRPDVLSHNPLALRRTMTLGEFSRLVALVAPKVLAELPPQATDAEKLAALVPAALASRHLFPPDVAAGDDIPDPYGRGEEVYRQALRQMTNQITTLERALHAK